VPTLHQGKQVAATHRLEACATINFLAASPVEKTGLFYLKNQGKMGIRGHNPLISPEVSRHGGSEQEREFYG
jgi:hypothetical protein